MNNMQRTGIITSAVAAFIMTAPILAAQDGKAKASSVSRAAKNAIKTRTSQDLATKQIRKRVLQPSP